MAEKPLYKALCGLVWKRYVAQMAELVDALVSGTSDASRGGSSPLLGTIRSLAMRFDVSPKGSSVRCGYKMLQRN